MRVWRLTRECPVNVDAGEVLDEVVLRSYCMGACPSGARLGKERSVSPSMPPVTCSTLRSDRSACFRRVTCPG